MNTVFLHAGRRRPRFLPLLALLGLVGLVPAARAAATDTELNSELKSLAEQIKPFLVSHSETAVSIGQFTSPPDLPSSSGPAICSALGAQLKSLGIDVKVRGTKYNIQGDYKYAEDPSATDHSHVLAIEARILDKNNQEMVGLNQMKPATIYSDAIVASLLGITSDLPPDGSAKARDDKIKDAYDNPQAHLDHTKIKAGDSPYEIEVLVKSGSSYVPRPPVDKDGLAFVELKKDEVYRVRVYNNSAYDAAVMLTIDGLNMFCFSDVKDAKGNPAYDRMVIHAHKSYDIPGWYRNNNKNGSDEFLVAKYADCEAAKMFPESASIGTITVSFAAAWAKDGTPPPDEPNNSKSIDLGTKRGAPTGDGYTLVERQFGVTRATVSVRYAK